MKDNGKLRRRVLGVIAMVLVATVLCGSCSSNSNMYKHRKSDCDCPSF